MPSEAIRSIEMIEVMYYLWRSEYGGLKDDQVKRLKSLEKLILKEAASGNF